MKIAFASDLHLEMPGAICDLSSLSGTHPDLIILAGDITPFPQEYAKLLAAIRSAVSHVPLVMVLGNHEYYGGGFPARIEAFRRAISWDRDAVILERGRKILGDVRILGTTLWTDFAGGRHLESCQNGMSDFVYIRDSSTGAEILPVVLREDHHRSVSWFERAFNEDWPGKTVVVTHHAPSFLSQHPKFAGSKIAGGFCSNLDERIMDWQPELWIHGHLHDPVDYLIGDSRIVSSPWGYPSEGRVRRFRLIDV